MQTVWKLLEKRNTDIELFEDIEIHIIEMPKVKKYKGNTEKGLSTWIEFLENPESELISMAKMKDVNLRDAFEKLRVISGNERLKRRAELKWKRILDENSMKDGAERRGLEKGMKRGIEQGMKQGMEQGMKYNIPIDVDTIKEGYPKLCA